MTYIIQEETLTDIADAIRTKTGTSDLIEVSDMAYSIASLEQGGAVSPTISVSEIEGGNRVTITDVERTQTFDVMDGVDGAPGRSAYQSYLDTGGELSEVEWVASLQPSVVIDATMTQEGKAADAKIVGLHINNSENPHGVTADQVGLGNVPNVTTNDQTPTYTEAATVTELTSGEKVSTAFGKLKKAVAELISHLANKSNPHGITTSQINAVPTSRKVNNKALSSDITLEKSDVGLGNVPNVATNDQTPTYTESAALTELSSGETVSTAFGKLKKAVKDLISHLANKSNPHGITAAQVGARPDTWTPTADDVGAQPLNLTEYTAATQEEVNSIISQLFGTMPVNSIKQFVMSTYTFGIFRGYRYHTTLYKALDGYGSGEMKSYGESITNPQRVIRATCMENTWSDWILDSDRYTFTPSIQMTTMQVLISAGVETSEFQVPDIKTGSALIVMQNPSATGNEEFMPYGAACLEDGYVTIYWQSATPRPCKTTFSFLYSV